MMKKNLPQNLNDLRSGCLSPKTFVKYQHVSSDLIKRLKLDTELVGHNGCVNCLEWNETGELLASGSDDTHVMIWDAFNHKRKTDIDTLHKGNIFSVKFMPKFNNTKLASGAADSCVKVIDISQETTIENYLCHKKRVKRLAVSPNDPYLLWSCSEDGTIRQFDIRENTNSQNTYQSSNVLLNLSSHVGITLEVKCLAINPVRTDQLAVGCNDSYVRLYDRRKLTLKSYQPTEKKTRNSCKRYSNGAIHSRIDEDFVSLPNDVVKYFVPSHIPWNSQSENKYTQYSCTYLTFSPDGNSLLVNMGSEQVYLYDVNKTRPSFSFQTSLARHVSTCDCALLCDYSNFRANSLSATTTNNGSATINTIITTTSTTQNGGTQAFSPSPSPPPLLQSLPEQYKETNGEMLVHLNILKDKGNKMYKNSDYHSAIMYYNTALEQGGDIYARFFANRAAAYISRNWTGDIFAALLDNIRALEIDYYHIKSHFRIAQCLFQLNMIAESNDYIKYLQYLFPVDAKKIKQVEELEKKIQDKITDLITKEDKEKSKATINNNMNGLKVNDSEVCPISTNIVDIIAKHTKTQRFLESRSLNEQEFRCRTQANDYVKRFCGHCNTTTDIKEANFFGIDGQYIMAGSDEGNIFFWDRSSENIIRVVVGDRNIVNCLQPHPTVCFLASSGIDSVIRLWSPSFSDIMNNHHHQSTEEEKNKIGTEQNEIKAAQSNQTRINSDPIEYMLMNMGYPTNMFSQNSDENEDNDEDGDDSEETEHNDNFSTPGRRGPRRRRIQLENTEFCRAS